MPRDTVGRHVPDQGTDGLTYQTTTPILHDAGAGDQGGPPPLLLTPEEAARALRCHRSALYDRMREGLPSLKLGRSRRFSRRAIEQWIADHQGGWDGSAS